MLTIGYHRYIYHKSQLCINQLGHGAPPWTWLVNKILLACGCGWWPSRIYSMVLCKGSAEGSVWVRLPWDLSRTLIFGHFISKKVLPACKCEFIIQQVQMAFSILGLGIHAGSCCSLGSPGTSHPMESRWTVSALMSSRWTPPELLRLWDAKLRALWWMVCGWERLLLSYNNTKQAPLKNRTVRFSSHRAAHVYHIHESLSI